MKIYPAHTQGAGLMLQGQGKSLDSLLGGPNKYSRSMIENTAKYASQFLPARQAASLFNGQEAGRFNRGRGCGFRLWQR
ncbi:MAG: hypothetical protein LBJ14_03955 [Desulfarculales bacterium]|jgi:hypothetical protein|nr:hypothetical protein [Desulfarculales bacterium]